MKYQILVSIIFMLVFSLGGNAQKKQVSGIAFENSWKEAMAKVSKSKKKPALLFVYFTQQENPACAKMGNLVLKTRQVSDFINRQFVSVTIDAGQVENKELIEHYRVSVLPSFLILDKNGEEVGQFCGSSDPEEFLKKLNFAMNPAHSVRMNLAAFKEDKTTGRGLECLEAYYRAGRISEMVQFLESIYYAYPPEERYSTEMWKYVAPALMNTTSKTFSLFLSEKYLANQYLGKPIVDKALAKSLRQYAFWFVSGKLKDDARDALLLISFLSMIDDQNLASHYIVVASQLYAQKNFTKQRAYDHILNYLSAEKVCALEAEEREFVEHFLMNIEGMPQSLIERYQKDREAYFKKQLEQGGKL